MGGWPFTYYQLRILGFAKIEHKLLLVATFLNLHSSFRIILPPISTDGQDRTDMEPINLSTPYESEGIRRYGHRSNSMPTSSSIGWDRCYLLFIKKYNLYRSRTTDFHETSWIHTRYAFVRLLTHYQFSATFQNHLTICYLITY